MDAHSKTYLRLTAPPSIALARMAMNAASLEVYGDVASSDSCPTPRAELPRVGYLASKAYYRIIDRVTWSSYPDWGTPNWCPKCSPADIGYCRCEIASNE